ncbi:hypothetical protein ACFL51_02285, partial [Myxococcota bacterium]
HLEVIGSLVVGNTDVGVRLSGAEGAITGSVVRDTVPNANGAGGRGISAECNASGLGCGRLEVSGSLVAGNVEVGVLALGAEATIIGSVVRDTVSNLSGVGGRGINAQCHSGGLGCGRLEVSGSLVAGNEDMGVFIVGPEATIAGSVVRDTVPDASGEGGRGLNAQCYPGGLGCGLLEVSSSLVAGNAELGVFLSILETTITGSVVRDTVPNASGAGGRGIEARCDPVSQGCGSLEVSGSLVAGNADLGVSLFGVEATITDAVVRDTVSAASGESGRGINVQCDPDVLACGRQEVSGSLVVGNADLGVSLFGAEATITGSVVRDTVPNASGEGGRGINAQCDPHGLGCGLLEVSSSLVAGSSNMGVYTAGVPATLAGVVVMDTSQNTEGQWAGDFGQGVCAVCDQTFDGGCATLEVTGCLVDSSFTVGVEAQVLSGSLQDSVVRQVAPRALDEAFGYGVQVEGIPGAPPTAFDIDSCQIQDATLAGVFYYLAGGTVRGSQITGGQYTVVMNQGANPTIQEDNDLSGSVESEPTWVNMDPAPAPPPLLPIELQM